MANGLKVIAFVTGILGGFSSLYWFGVEQQFLGLLSLAVAAFLCICFATVSHVIELLTEIRDRLPTSAESSRVDQSA